ncbi:MAG: PDZ domain-containing protein [Armatimonadetes bacterium]|nr:PDZ domain-containing protein [Armatimonadota bacterium]
MSTFTRLRSLGVAVLAAVAFQIGAAQGPSAITTEQKDTVLKDMESIITKSAYVPGVDFKKWPDLVLKHRKDIDAAKDDAQFTATMNEALHDFGFSHIVLFSPQAADVRNNRKMVGLGVRIQPEEKGLRIVMVFPGTPAEEVGMEPGDLIITGDGKPVKTTADLAGEEGTTVKVTVERKSKKIDFEIKRRKFSTDIPESITWVSKDTAMVTIPTFDLGYKKYRVAEIMNEAMSSKNLILDLRSNGGGQVQNLLNLASYFFDTSDPIGTFVNRLMADDYSKSTGKPGIDAIEVAKWVPDKVRLRPDTPRSEHYAGKVAVLINGGTGSASEMMAAALREKKGAKLIGSKSAGAVLASLMRPISERFLLQYPVMDYVTINGLRIEGNGLVPDKEATPAVFGKADEAVALAVKTFNTP